ITGSGFIVWSSRRVEKWSVSAGNQIPPILERRADRSKLDHTERMAGRVCPEMSPDSAGAGNARVFLPTSLPMRCGLDGKSRRDPQDRRCPVKGRNSDN